ncbi:unnamed protein product [Allacma fusca]|uniref:Integrase zinc-binding domain-containing protein n=1 Tax=Allacma fusca TaxID=39272 RepID=A0A8J2PKA9_9HEXA|nr:unnamed protein product [Allacma fusca]
MNFGLRSMFHQNAISYQKDDLIGYIEVPDSVKEEWSRYREELSVLESIKIPRCIKSIHETSYELVGFSDASETACGAVVYLRSFITKPEKLWAFTDSTVVLAWLKEHPKHWNTYVANRVSAIQDIIPYENWFHVPGIENPADSASRGIQPSELVTHALWCQGPKFLLEEEFNCGKPNSVPEEALKEQRKRVKRNFAVLSAVELQQALLISVKLVQQNEFPAEVTLLKIQKSIPVKSRLRSLNPFVDEAGLLRVGGRLEKSKISDGRKHPLIIPRHHVLTNLIINYAHEINLHGSCKVVLAYIQRQFWILNGRDAVRRQIRKCVRCCRFRSETATQMLGNLPSVQVSPARSFVKVGTDLPGPIILRMGKGGNQHDNAGLHSSLEAFCSKMWYSE